MSSTRCEVAARPGCGGTSYRIERVNGRKSPRSSPGIRKIVAANLSVAHWGNAVPTPSFFIGLDLTLP
jgi:hypothetical protein